MLIHFRLVKAGYGTLSEIREMDARTVLQSIHYENFLGDYESAFMEINSNDNS